MLIMGETGNLSAMDLITGFLKNVDSVVWGLPLILLIILTGIYLTVRMKGLQIRHLGKALKFMVRNEEGGEGEVSSFGALCTALSATIGTGNIVGVATAIAAGGPGALFWMIVAAIFGMATKYTEGFLAIKYRTVDEDGHVLGGPFYYIEKGMGTKWRWLAKLFALFGVCAGLMGIGTITQINGITSAVQSFFDPSKTNIAFTIGNMSYSWEIVIAGLAVTVCTALVIIGGLKRISKVAQIVVPFMAIMYFVFAMILILGNLTAIPGAIKTVVYGAFGIGDPISGIRAAAGGVLGAMFAAMQNGVARGIFSNEAGLGSAPIASAAAKTKDTVKQGLVSMTGTFIDTIVICTLTGLSIVLAGSWANESLQGVEITMDAFSKGIRILPSSVVQFILMLCLVFFAFTTILGWDYYSERCLEYLSNRKKGLVKSYRWIYVAAVFIGPYLTVEAVWVTADIFNGLMAIPNIIALIALSGIVAKETNAYFKAGKHLEKKK